MSLFLKSLDKHPTKYNSFIYLSISPHLSPKISNTFSSIFLNCGQSFFHTSEIKLISSTSFVIPFAMANSFMLKSSFASISIDCSFILININFKSPSSIPLYCFESPSNKAIIINCIILFLLSSKLILSLSAFSFLNASQKSIIFLFCNNLLIFLCSSLLKSSISLSLLSTYIACSNIYIFSLISFS